MLTEIVKKPEIFLVKLLKDSDSMKRFVNQNPEVALAALREVSGSQSLSLPVQARALEMILAEISANPEKARELLNAHLMPETQAEMIAVMGDLPSVACQVVNFETLLAALEMDISQDNTSGLEPYLLIRAWAMNLKDRPEWEEELEFYLGRYTLRTLLIAAVFDECGGDVEIITPDLWVQVGLDPDEAPELLQQLLDEGGLPEFYELSVAQARQRLRERTQVFEEQTSSSTIGRISDEIDV